MARARGVAVEQVRGVVARLTEGRDLGILGEPRVNVLKLNLALDREYAGSAVLLPAQTAGESQLLRRISELEQRLAAVEARQSSAPAHVAGIAGYAKYQFAPAFSLAARWESMSDQGGFLSGATQTLREATLTTGYQPKDGFQVRWDSHDGQPAIFRGIQARRISEDQNTALLGLLWGSEANRVHGSPAARTAPPNAGRAAARGAGGRCSRAAGTPQDLSRLCVGRGEILPYVRRGAAPSRAGAGYRRRRDPTGRPARRRGSAGEARGDSAQSRGAIDVDAIVRRRPAVCVIDGLAYDNPPGSRHPTRWQDVGEIVQAGIKVIGSINVQYVAELKVQVEAITGKRVTETVPFEFLKNADEIEIVDAAVTASPQLNKLRELALVLAADVVDHQLNEYLERHGVRQSFGAHERILVCVTPRANVEDDDRDGEHHRATVSRRVAGGVCAPAAAGRGGPGDARRETRHRANGRRFD